LRALKKPASVASQPPAADDFGQWKYLALVQDSYAGTGGRVGMSRTVVFGLGLIIVSFYVSLSLINDLIYDLLFGLTP
jgi:hypothetical protein